MNSIHKDGFYLSDEHDALVQVIDGQELIYSAQQGRFVPRDDLASSATMHDPSPINFAKAVEQMRYERAHYLRAKDGESCSLDHYFEGVAPVILEIPTNAQNQMRAIGARYGLTLEEWAGRELLKLVQVPR